MKTTSQVKTRQEIADEYGISRKTLYRWLKIYDIPLKGGLVSLLEQEKIYAIFGQPKPKKKWWR